MLKELGSRTKNCVKLAFRKLKACSETSMPRFAELQSLWHVLPQAMGHNCIDWHALYDKLYVHRPTGLGRAQLWELFWNKHRVNPWREQEYQGSDYYTVRDAWRAAQWEMGQYQGDSIPFYMDLVSAIQAFKLENDAAKKAVAVVRDRHSRRWQTKEGTYRIKKLFFLAGCDGSRGILAVQTTKKRE